MTDMFRGPLRILAVDDDARLLKLYREALDSAPAAGPASGGFELAICKNSRQALDLVARAVKEDAPFAMIFLDPHLGAGPDGITAGERIRAMDPHMNFIIVTGVPGVHADRISRRIRPVDKLLFVQKPLHTAEVRQLAEAMGAKWVSERLLRQANAALEEKIAELERSRLALMDNKNELEYVNTQLLETNGALSVLARNLENTRKESEKQVLRKTRTLIIPTIEKLKRDKRLARYQTDLDLLVGYVENLTTDISDKTRNAEALSATESRIASMIRLGLTSEEIADHLSVSVSTVKTHRKNIRHKLKLKNTGKNLRAYLESRLAPDR